MSEAVPISRIPDFGAHVSNQSAMNITAMYAGIRIRSENIASFPKNVKRKTSQGLVDVPDHPVFSVINDRPNPFTNKFDFWNCICTWLDGWGNAAEAKAVLVDAIARQAAQPEDEKHKF